MGWEVPKHWRAIRQKHLDLHDMPILDLAVWDQNYHQRQQKRRRRGLSNGSGCFNDNVDEHGNDIRTAEEHCGTPTTQRVAATNATAADEVDKHCYDRQEEKKDCLTEEHQC